MIPALLIYNCIFIAHGLAGFGSQVGWFSTHCTDFFHIMSNPPTPSRIKLYEFDPALCRREEKPKPEVITIQEDEEKLVQPTDKKKRKHFELSNHPTRISLYAVPKYMCFPHPSGRRRRRKRVDDPD